MGDTLSIADDWYEVLFYFLFKDLRVPVNILVYRTNHLFYFHGRPPRTERTTRARS